MLSAVAWLLVYELPPGFLPAGLGLLAAVLVPAFADYSDVGKFSKPVEGYKGSRPVKPNYSYQYGIDDYKSGVKINAKERRKGYTTVGQYSTKLPDGRKQKVSYYVDGKSGFVADVKYEGVAKHPVKVKKPVKHVKYGGPFKPHKPAVVPFKPVVSIHNPAVTVHKPVLKIHKLPKPPVDIQFGYGDHDDDDGYASYQKGFPSKPFHGYIQGDIHPGQTYSQYGHEYDPYAQSSKLFQQQFYQ